MNIRRYSVLAAFAGAAFFLLRLLQRKTGFEAETGLAVRGNLFALALVVALILSGAALLLAVRKTPFAAMAAKYPFAQLFSFEGKTLPKTLAVGGVMAMVAAGGLEIFSAVTMTRDVLSLAAGALLVVAAVCLFGAVKALGSDREGEGTFYLAAVCCAVVQLVASYRLYAVDPVLQSYYVELLCLVLHVLAFYALCGLYFSGCGFGRFLFFTLAALLLTLTSLADGHGISEMLMLLGMSGAEMGFLLAAAETFAPGK